MSKPLISVFYRRRNNKSPSVVFISEWFSCPSCSANCHSLFQKLGLSFKKINHKHSLSLFNLPFPQQKKTKNNKKQEEQIATKIKNPQQNNPFKRNRREKQMYVLTLQLRTNTLDASL